MDIYVGGAEHAVMHLLYARFWTKALRDIGPAASSTSRSRGSDHQGTVLGPDGVKMSKSRGNVIAPDAVVSEFGADAVRGYLMFMGPFDQGGPWNNQGIEGVRRFLFRTWALAQEVIEANPAAENGKIGNSDPASPVERLRHKMIARVTDDYANLRFNTALAALMEFVNTLNKAKDESPDALRAPEFAAALDSLLLLLAPLTPHIAEELWHQRGHTETVHTQPWPAYDPALTVDAVVTVVVQVNGKLRDKLDVAPDTTEEAFQSLALASAKVQSAIEGKTVKKFIYVPGRLANIVV